MLTATPKTNPFAPREYGTLHQVTERTYIFRNITNSSFVIGDKGVAVIDTQVNQPLAERLLKLVRSVTQKPILYVINTHYHWDHTSGNALFKSEGAEIISSKLTKEFMTARAPRQKEFLSGRGFELGKDPLLPETTFEGHHEIDLGNMPLHLFFAGSAETDDATAVHVPTESVLMSGDTVMTGSFPIFGQPVWDEGLQGDGAWEKTIANLLSKNPKHIIPGHGPLAYEKEINLLLQIEKYFNEEVKKLVQRGFTPDQTLADLEPRLPEWIKKIPVVWGSPRYAILRVYRGLTRGSSDKELGWQQHKPSSIPGASSSAVEGKIKNKKLLKEYLQIANEAKEGGDPALRLTVLKKATESFSADVDSWLEYADALIEESRKEDSVLEKGDFFQAARNAWDRVLASEPSHTKAMLGKGRYLTMMAYRGGDDPSEGMSLLKRVAEKESTGRLRAEAEFYLGIGHRRLGDETKALEQFKKALKFDAFFMPARLAQN